MIDHDRLNQIRRGVEDTGGGLTPELCRSVADLLGVTDATFALIGGPDRRFTLCASSDNARKLDQWQFTLEQGPCLDAAAQGETSEATTTPTDESPWPLLAEKATELGYQAIAGIPLSIADRPYGAMNIQHTSPLQSDVLDYAADVCQTLSQPIMDRLAEQAPTLTDLGDYTTVHQAVGVVSVQMGIPIADALAVIRARSWTEGRLLVDVANDVIQREIEFDNPTDPEN